jgi:hypothetical protein
MSIDECEAVYVDLSEKIFTPNRSTGNVVGQALDFVNARDKFSTDALEDTIKEVVKNRTPSEMSCSTTKAEMDARCKSRTLFSNPRVSPNSCLGSSSSSEKRIVEILFYAPTIRRIIIR